MTENAVSVERAIAGDHLKVQESDTLEAKYKEMTVIVC